MSTPLNIAKCLEDGKITCDLIAKKFENVKSPNMKHSSPTQISFAELKECNIPLSVKVFFDITDLPFSFRDSKVSENYLQAIHGLKYEVKVYMEIINQILDLNYSPNFVRGIGYTECHLDKIPNIVSKNVMSGYYNDVMELYPDLPLSVLVTEKAGGTEAKNIFTLFQLAQTEEYVEFEEQIMFQIIYSLIVMQRFRLVHNDLHAGNILVAEYTNPRKMVYLLGNRKFLIETRFVPYIFDWDFSYSDLLGENKKVSYFCKDFNICNRFSEKSDLYTLLCTLGFENDYGYWNRLSAKKEDGNKIPITSKEEERLRKYPYYIKNIFKMGRAQLDDIFGENVERYFGKGVTHVMFELFNKSIIVYNPFACRATSYSTRMPTPMELLDDKFDAFEVNSIPRYIKPQNIYSLPEVQQGAKIYKDPFRKDSRHKISTYPRSNPIIMDDTVIENYPLSKRDRVKMIDFMMRVYTIFNMTDKGIIPNLISIFDYYVSVEKPNPADLPDAILAILFILSYSYGVNITFNDMRRRITGLNLNSFKKLVDKIGEYQFPKTSYYYLTKVSKLFNDNTKDMKTLSTEYLLNALQQYDSLQYPQSLIAVAVYATTREFFGLGGLNRLAKYTGYDKEEIKKVMSELIK